MDVAREIKSDAELKSIPIIAVTASVMKGDRQKILDAGCDDFVAKPINSTDLGRALRKWLC
jgi:two-component system cell cycle response regulator DivK